MKQFLIISVAIIASVTDSLAINLFKKNDAEYFDYTAWVDTTELPSSANNGRPLFYPASGADGAIICGQIDLPGFSADNIFLSALNYATDNLDATDNREMIGDIDATENKFVLRLYSKQGSNNTETTFTRLMLIKAEDNRLLFTVYEIDVRYREKGILPRTLAFEKLNPTINTRHRELVELFAQINTNYIHDMTDNVSKCGVLEVTHWNEIRDKVVSVGMNELEVKLILGRPVTTRDAGDRTRWVYPNNYVIIFQNNIVSRIVE
ncbi:MAG: outer membrane protein assembly factor BamE [Bacteroides sp.]|nr:outer membrane protein assembly factor BamE [Bacteroides sp.]